MGKYQVNVNGNEYLLSSEDAHSLNITFIDEETIHLLEKNRSVIVEINIQDHSGKSMQLQAFGERHKVAVLNEQDLVVKRMGFSTQKGSKINHVKAPMPGLVLEIMVKVNQEVKKGDALLVLEAMKMENLIRAPSAGLIKVISINKGETLDKGQLMLEIA